MIRNVKTMAGYKIAATDGVIGHVDDFLFDDKEWTIRYMVADTGDWLTEHKVLISPISLDTPDWDGERLPVRLSVQEVADAPKLDTHAPVSREYEIRWFNQYGWRYYWTGAGPWGGMAVPSDLFSQPERDAALREEPEPESAPTELRSVNEVINYRIHARDGNIGHVEDFLMDDETWAVRYMVIDTRNWLPGKKVLIAPGWIESIAWSQQAVAVDLERESIQHCPAYEPSQPLDREYEKRLHEHYGKDGYW